MVIFVHVELYCKKDGNFLNPSSHSSNSGLCRPPPSLPADGAVDHNVAHHQRLPLSTASIDCLRQLQTLLLTAMLLPAKDCLRPLPPSTASIDRRCCCWPRLRSLSKIAYVNCLHWLPPSTADTAVDRDVAPHQKLHPSTASVRHQRPSLLTLLLTATSLPAEDTPCCLNLSGMEDWGPSPSNSAP